MLIITVNRYQVWNCFAGVGRDSPVTEPFGYEPISSASWVRISPRQDIKKQPSATITATVYSSLQGHWLLQLSAQLANLGFASSYVRRAISISITILSKIPISHLIQSYYPLTYIHPKRRHPLVLIHRPGHHRIRYKNRSPLSSSLINSFWHSQLTYYTFTTSIHLSSLISCNH